MTDEKKKKSKIGDGNHGIKRSIWKFLCCELRWQWKGFDEKIVNADNYKEHINLKPEKTKSVHCPNLSPPLACRSSGSGKASRRDGWPDG
jgi:hypothetical protein